MSKILAKCEEMGDKWQIKMALCEIGETSVYDALIDIGYKIIRFKMKKEDKISDARKREKAKEPTFPDALAFYLGSSVPRFGEIFFCDPKFKGSHLHLGVINVNDYNRYVKFLRNFTVLANFKIFFYIEDAKEIWVHNLRNPKANPSFESTIEPMRGNLVYRIFRSELEFWKRVYTEE